jgi:RecA/RadA recombinase
MCSPTTAWELLSNTTPLLRTGCPHIDALLGGGLRAGITESTLFVFCCYNHPVPVVLTRVCKCVSVTGESASGKTQFVLQLLLQVQRPVGQGGLAGGAVFLSSEGPFPDRRVLQMIESRVEQHDPPIAFRDSIYLESMSTLENQEHVLFTRLPALLRQQSVRLIVLDSITALFRAEGCSSVAGFHDRSTALFRIAAHLHRLSREFQLPVVVRFIPCVLCETHRQRTD